MKKKKKNLNSVHRKRKSNDSKYKTVAESTQNDGKINCFSYTVLKILFLWETDHFHPQNLALAILYFT